MITNKSITYWIIILPILAVILTSTILTVKFISYEKYKFTKDSQKLETEYVDNIKIRIKNRINRLINLIEKNNQASLEEEKEKIKEFVNVSYVNIKSIYNKNKNLPNEQIIKKITDSLENLRFFNNKKGYFFIIDFNNKLLMHPKTPEEVNTLQKNLENKNKKILIQNFTKLAKTTKGSFVSWFWMEEKTKSIKEKIGYIKAFKPLNIYIGTGRFKDNISQEIKNKTKSVISAIQYGKDEYVFTMDKKGTTVAHINKTFIGKTIHDISDIEKDILNNILEKAKNKDGGFIYYTPTSHNVKTISKKISFVKTVPSFNWVIGTGQYTDIIQERLKIKRNELKEALEEAISIIIFISFSLSFILIGIMVYISKKIKAKFSFYEKQVALKNKKLKKLNENLEQKVNEQVLKIRQKDELLHQQSKLASMGEMIGNIAHQWRQPLSAISTAASGIKIHYELNILDQKTMNQALDAIVDNTQVLSQTIEDFRNFFKKDKVKTTFQISNVIKKVLLLIDANLYDKEIKVIENIEDSKLFCLENELIQALLNILNNAKDALEEIKEEKYIFINVEDTKDEITIKIKDNAGGIKDEVLPKIFEPYFTTKFNSQGTGIGLYMTQSIIVNHMEGKLKVKNEEFIYKEKKYIGALFEIKLKK